MLFLNIFISLCIWSSHILLLHAFNNFQRFRGLSFQGTNFEVFKKNGIYNRFFPVWLRPKVGETLIAEVEGMNDGNTAIDLKIRKDGEIHSGKMSIKPLLPQERLLLQNGALVKVFIDSEDASNNFRVSLARKGQVVSQSPAARSTPPQIQRRLTPQNGQIKSNTSLPPNGLLLNDLKTGMALEVTVKSVSPFAAFVTTNVYRRAKGGFFTTIDAILHRTDIPLEMLAPTPQGYSIIYQKGTKLTVYVKEVLKQAGKLSVTTNPNFRKSDLLKDKEKRRQAGNIRRRTRRLRKQLENVVAGETVSGIVDRVVPEGIIVNINSLGGLAIPALVRNEDLPRHYQLPPSIATPARLDILKLDFVQGRKISAGVIKVDEQPSIIKPYCMRVSLEGMGPLSDESLDIPRNIDFADLSGRKRAREADEEEEEEEEFVEDWEANSADGTDDTFDEDIGEIFLDLTNGKHQLTVADIFEWEEMIDMLDQGLLRQEEVYEMLSEATGSKITGGSRSKEPTSINRQQFSTLCRLIRNTIDTRTPSSSFSSSSAATATSNDSNQSSGEAEEQEEDENDDDEEDIEPSSVEEEYEQLKDHRGRVTLQALLQWEEVQGLIEEGFVTEAEVVALLNSVLQRKKPIEERELSSIEISKDQFMEFIEGIDGIAGGEDEEEDMSNDDEQDGEVEMEKEESDADDEAWEEEQRQEMFRSLQEMNPNRAAKKKIRLQDFKDDEDVKSVFDEEVLSEQEWRDIVAGVLGKGISDPKNVEIDYSQFKAILSELDRRVEEHSEGGEEDVEDDRDEEKGEEEEVQDNGWEGEEEELSEEDLQKARRDLFEELRSLGSYKKKSPSNSISTQALKESDDIQGLFEDGDLTEEEWQSVLSSVTSLAKQSKLQRLTFEQMCAVLNKIDDIIAERGLLEKDDNLSALRKDQREDDAKNSDNDNDSGEAEPSEEELLAARRQLFDSLKSTSALSNQKRTNQKEGADLILVRDLRASEEIDELFEEGYLNEEQWTNIVAEATKLTKRERNAARMSDKLLSFDQFNAIIDQINAVIETVSEDDEEEEGNDEYADSDENFEDDEDLPEARDSLREEAVEEEEEVLIARAELFQRLLPSFKGKKVSESEVKIFAHDLKATEDIQQLFSLGVLTDQKWQNLLATATESSVSSLRKQQNILLSYSDFDRLLDALDAIIAEGKENSSKESTGRRKLETSLSNVEETEDPFTVEEIKANFDKLRGTSSTITEVDLLQWEELKPLLREKLLSREDVTRALYAVQIQDPNRISEEQFGLFANKVMRFVYGLDEEGLPPLPANHAREPDTISSSQAVNDDHSLPSSSGISVETKSTYDSEDMTTAMEEMLESVENYSDAEIKELFEAILSSSSSPKRLKESKDRQVVTFAQLLQHEEFEEIVSLGLYSKEELRQLLVEKIGMDPILQTISFPQFKKFIDLIQSEGEEDSEVSKGKDVSNEGTQQMVVGEDSDDKVQSSEPSREDILEIYNELKGKGTVLPVENVRVWDDMMEMMEDGVLTKTQLDLLLQKVGGSSGSSIPRSLTFDQFYHLTELLGKMIQTHQQKVEDSGAAQMSAHAKMSKANSPDFKAAMRAQFDAIRSKGSQVISFAQFTSLPEVKAVTSRDSGIMTLETLQLLWKEYQNKQKPSQMTFPQFLEMRKIIESARELSEKSLPSDEKQVGGTTSGASDGRDDEEYSEDDQDTDDRYEEKTRYIFDSLKSAKSEKILVRRLLKSSLLRDILAETALTREDVQAILTKRMGVAEDDTLKYPQFQQFLHYLNEFIQTKSSKRSPAQASPETKNLPVAEDNYEEDEEADGELREQEEEDEGSVSNEDLLENLRQSIFSQISQKKGGFANIKDLMEMEGSEDLFGSDESKRSYDLEKVAKQFGVRDPSRLSYEEFTKVLNEFSRRHNEKTEKQALQTLEGTNPPKEALSPEVIKRRTELEQQIASVIANPSVYSPIDPLPEVVPLSALDKEAEIEYENESGMMAKSPSDEENLSQTFEGLKTSRSSELNLIDLLRWNEIQEMIAMEALSVQKLAQAIDAAVSRPENSSNQKKTQTSLSFDQFKQVIANIDDVLDWSKLPQPDNEEEEGEDSDAAFSQFSVKGEASSRDSKDLSVREDDEDLDNDEDGSISKEDVKEMFETLSKGKKVISRMDLARWEDLQQLVSEGLCSERQIDSYLAELPSDEVTIADFSGFVEKVLDVKLEDVQSSALQELMPKKSAPPKSSKRPPSSGNPPSNRRR